jgi:hypothetical protein
MRKSVPMVTGLCCRPDLTIDADLIRTSPRRRGRLGNAEYEPIVSTEPELTGGGASGKHKQPERAFAPSAAYAVV